MPLTCIITRTKVQQEAWAKFVVPAPREAKEHIADNNAPHGEAIKPQDGTQPTGKRGRKKSNNPAVI